MRRFSASELKDYLDQHNEPALLLDVREPWEFEKCHLDSSILIPMQQVAKTIGNFDPKKVTVVICHHGIRSRQVAYYLERQGFDNIINLEGGVEAWAQEIDLSMQRY